MHVFFSWHFDGLSTDAPTTGVGEVAVGPKGLLNLIEGDLGLAPVLQHAAEQLVVFRGCLAAADNPDRFYHASFQVDPINVAATLMRWRERWYDGGWDGTAPVDCGHRIRDMAAVEAIASVMMPPCGGQRVQRILAVMHPHADAQEGRCQIRRITLAEPLADIPAKWRELVSSFACCEPEEPRPFGDGGDLALVQDAVLNGARHALSGDASFLVVRAASRDLSATHVAEMLREIDPYSCLLVAERDGIIVDNALERVGLPRVGFQHYSKFRAISQVLKLSLGLLWRPLDPQHLLQFLLHPDAPLSRRVRRGLAEAVSREPGVGGTAWQQQVAFLREGLDGAADARLLALLETWFGDANDSKFFSPEHGAPLEVLLDRVKLVAGWLARRLSEQAGESDLYAAALAQADALASTLQRLAADGATLLSRIELEYLVDEAASHQPDPALRAQVGHVRATTFPGHVAGGWPEVFWWDLAVGHGETHDPWSSAEVQDLAALGVELPTLEVRLQRQASAWLRPVLSAQRRFVLVVHDSERVQHPLWVRLQSLVSGWREVRLETSLLSGSMVGEVTVAPLPVTLLPQAKRWWHLAAQSIPMRSVESYSSLHNLYYAPHQWALRYAALLRPGRAEDLTDGPRLYGNVAHRVFERFFTEHGEDWHRVDTLEWMQVHLPKLIETEAAILLQPGRGADRQRMVRTLEDAMMKLVSHLKAADVVQVACEVPAEGTLVSGQKLQGTIDLVLRTSDGREMVVDAKYGGEKYRGDDLASGEHLQLATYAYLRSASAARQAWPEVAYFIISTGNLLATSDSSFPSATVYKAEEASSIHALWERSLATYEWRRSQLDEGWIEANSPLAAITPRSVAPENALETQSKGSDFDDFVHLLGWEPLA